MRRDSGREYGGSSMTRPLYDWEREVSSAEHECIRRAVQSYAASGVPKEEKNLADLYDHVVSACELEHGPMGTDHREAVEQAARHYFERNGD